MRATWVASPRFHVAPAGAGAKDDRPPAAATTSSRPVVLLYDTKAGHAGGRSLTKVIDDTTMEMAFLARELGMTVP